MGFTVSPGFSLPPVGSKVSHVAILHGRQEKSERQLLVVERC